VNVCEVLDQYASLTHLKLIRDNFVQGEMSLNVTGLSPEKTIDIIERTLFSNGYSIVQVDTDTVEIVGTGRTPRTIGVPVLADPKELPKQERIISYVFGFKYRNAVEMQQIFGQYLSPRNTWTSFQASSKSDTLLVTERSSVIRSLLEVTAKMDVPDAKEKP
jgi:type II secretory pathway component GspD/PulD (secretin)